MTRDGAVQCAYSQDPNDGYAAELARDADRDRWFIDISSDAYEALDQRPVVKSGDYTYILLEDETIALLKIDEQHQTNAL